MAAKVVNEYKATDLVQSSLGPVIVDTRLSIDEGWQTTVFKSTPTGTVVDWTTSLEFAQYKDVHEAREGHQWMTEKWSVKK